jgi:hypothetical protein
MYSAQKIFQHHFQCKKVRIILDKIRYVCMHKAECLFVCVVVCYRNPNGGSDGGASNEEKTSSIRFPPGVVHRRWAGPAAVAGLRRVPGERGRARRPGANVTKLFLTVIYGFPC